MLAISLVSTGAVALSAVPHEGRWSTTRWSAATSPRCAASSCCSPRSASLGFVLNVVSGLRYTRVSAEILFDMRLALYAHLQRLSPRFYARTRLGDIVVADQQRHRRDPARRRRSGAGLGRQRPVPRRQRRDAGLARLAAVSRRRWRPLPLSLWALVRYRRRLEARVAELRQRSADIGSFLIETLQAHALVVDVERAGSARRRASAA